MEHPWVISNIVSCDKIRILINSEKDKNCRLISIVYHFLCVINKCCYIFSTTAAGNYEIVLLIKSCHLKVQTFNKLPHYRDYTLKYCREGEVNK